MSAPGRIWIDHHGGNWSPVPGGTQEHEYTRADLVPTAPKVKALVWVELARGLFGATTPFGCYHVWEGHYQAPCDKMGQPALDPRSEAQADYEARILAALEGGDA